jgi:pimeloyl-ACP methyl ester carboxylesterase
MLRWKDSHFGDNKSRSHYEYPNRLEILMRQPVPSSLNFPPDVDEVMARLTMPVLSIAGEKASAAILGPQMKLVAKDVTVINLKDTGHWLLEERPQETMDALIAFL